MKNWTELSVLVDQYVAAHKCKNLGGIEGAMLAGCGLNRDKPEDKYHIEVTVYAPRKLSPDEKRLVTKSLMVGTPLEYEGESYNVVVRRFQTELPKLL